MTIAAIIVAVVVGFLVLRFVAGMVKFAILAVVILACLYFAGVFN
jgi:hypothetical protein